MGFTDRTSSKPQSQADLKKLFVGRVKELNFFVEKILKAEKPSHNIISISGQGGVGKTTLVERFIVEAQTEDFNDYCLTALVNERQTTSLDVMKKFADQLEIKGKFERALKEYEDALRRIRDSQEAAGDALLSNMPDALGAAAKAATPLPVINEIAGEGTKVMSKAVIDHFQDNRLREDERKLKDPIGNLTKLFVDELNALTDTYVTLKASRTKRKRRILLFFDTFEQLAPALNPWLLDHLLEAEIDINIVLVIAGRNSIERSVPENLKLWLPFLDKEIIYPIALETLTEDETRQYLSKQGITDQDITTIWEFSRGLPLYLSLLTSNPSGRVDPTKDIIDNILRWIPEEEKRKLVRDAAFLSMPFNQDEFDAFAYLSKEARPIFYEWLTDQPFVQRNQDGRFFYHEVAQEQFRRHVYQNSPNEYYATCRFLAEYYQSSLEKGQARWRDEWFALKLALAYQLFCLPDDDNHTKAIEQVLSVYHESKQVIEIDRMLRLRVFSQEQLNSRISPDTRQNARLLLQYTEAYADLTKLQQIAKELLQSSKTNLEKHPLLKSASDILERVAHDPSFSPKQLEHIYRNRGNAYYYLGEYQQALDDYDRVIELNPTGASAYPNRGLAHFALKEYQKAIADYTRAIKLNPTYARAYNERGLVYEQLKEYQQALADYDQAIELNPDDVSTYHNRGLVYVALKEYQKAIADYVD